MGLIARQAGAPIADGETSSGTEIEAEFDTMFGEINGTLVNANIATGANIQGTKIGDNTVAVAKLVSTVGTEEIAEDTIDTEEMIAAAVTQAYIDTDTGTETTTTSGSFQDIPGVVDWTVTPGSTSNYILMEFMCHVAHGTGGTYYEFGFDVNGTPTAALIRCDIDYATPQSWYMHWMTTAPTAGSMVVKPQYRRSTGSATTTFSTTNVAITKIFRGMIIPVK